MLARLSVNAHRSGQVPTTQIKDTDCRRSRNFSKIPCTYVQGVIQL